MLLGLDHLAYSSVDCGLIDNTRIEGHLIGKITKDSSLNTSKCPVNETLRIPPGNQDSFFF